MKAAIDNVIRKYGEAVEYTPAGGTMQTLIGCVQVPQTDALVNDFDLTGFVVYLRTSDFSTPPSKFDRLKVRGVVRAVEDVQVENLSGEDIVYMLRVRG